MYEVVIANIILRTEDEDRYNELQNDVEAGVLEDKINWLFGFTDMFTSINTRLTAIEEKLDGNIVPIHVNKVDESEASLSTMKIGKVDMKDVSTKSVFNLFKQF